MAFTFLVYPCLILAYMGVAAFPSKHHEDIDRSFYKAIPGKIIFKHQINDIIIFSSRVDVVNLSCRSCVLASVHCRQSIVGSQAVMSATFSIISAVHSIAFRVSKSFILPSKIYGQIYIPEVSWMLMCLCLAKTVGLRDTKMLSHVYGTHSSYWLNTIVNLSLDHSQMFIMNFDCFSRFVRLAVTLVMLVTTCLMGLVLITVWKQRIFIVVAFFLCFGSVELLCISTYVYKIPERAWNPLVLSFIFMAVMYIWTYGTTKKHDFDMERFQWIE